MKWLSMVSVSCKYMAESFGMVDIMINADGRLIAWPGLNMRELRKHTIPPRGWGRGAVAASRGLGSDSSAGTCDLLGKERAATDGGHQFADDMLLVTFAASSVVVTVEPARRRH
jgi:hypothetical protein